jgi:acyl-CoA thioesterase-2
VSQALDDLIELLDLEKIEENIYRGTQPDEDRQRVFGGQVAGQALVAAARTVVDDRHVHSLHAYFLRSGDPTVPIVYEVDRLRDGRSFTTRRVVAIQHGRPIFNLQASFHTPEESRLDYHLTAPTDVPAPDTLPTFHERLEPHRDRVAQWIDRPRPIDTRYAPPDHALEPGLKTDGQLVWMRADGTLPDDPVLHACIVTYASDMTLLDTALRPSGISSFTHDLMMASLDHAMWFHRPFRADEWLLYQQSSLSASDARGLAGGSIFTSDGDLVVNVVQEGLIRVVS